MNNGESESAAQTAMQEAIDEYFTTIEKNVLVHFNAQLAQIVDLIQVHIEHLDFGGVSTYSSGGEWDVANSTADNAPSG